MNSFFNASVVVVVCIMTLTSGSDLKEPYFKTVTLECEDNSANFTNYNLSSLKGRHWIFPSGKVFKNSDDAPTCGRDKCWDMDPSGFNITIKRINDEDFGVYFCVMVMKDHSVFVIRKGLNVDGPDYGDLIARYKENAIVGAIAAAVLFVVVGGSCLVWNCRYNKRKSIYDKENGDLTDINMVHAYDNKTTELDDEKL